MRALLSVSDKTGLVDLARGLSERHVELISTGGTARALGDAGLRVTGVSEVTGFPEMMGWAGQDPASSRAWRYLARRDRPDDLSAIEGHGIRLIDIVVVNLYPFARAAADPDTTFDELIEQIDIGGPSMVRAAAKNFRDVLVIVDPVDYERVLKALDDPDQLDPHFRLRLPRRPLRTPPPMTAPSRRRCRGWRRQRTVPTRAADARRADPRSGHAGRSQAAGSPLR